MAKNHKTSLKEARELLKEKEYSAAIKICKNILKEDKQNYNALVVMGAAMRGVKDFKHQASNPLKKAIAIQPDNVLAWHGLVTHYEDQPDNIETWIELIPIYKKLLQLESDITKFIQYLKNVTTTLIKLKNDESLSQTISVLCKLKEERKDNKDVLNLLNEAVMSILTQYPKQIRDYDELLKHALSSLIQDENSANRYENYKKYLKILYRCQDFSQLMSEAVKMHEIFNKDIYSLEWLCRVYSEYSITHGNCNEVNITILYQTLLDHDPESILAYFAKAVTLYETGNLIDARNILNHLVTGKPKWFYAWLLLSKIAVLLYCWEDAEMAALHAQKLIPEGDPYNLRQVINLILLEALVKSSNKTKWNKAESSFEELSDDSMKSSVLRAHLYVQLRDSRAKMLINDLINNPNTRVQALILRSVDLLHEKHLEEAADVLGSILETPEAWLTLGKIHWEMADYGHSLMAFLKGISTDPNNWECLLYLGLYYQEHSQDYERSRKCYQKALQINPNCHLAGIGLSSMHRILKKTDENMQFLIQLTNQGTGPKWALIQLGLQYLDHNNPTDAVLVLRNAVKTDPTDSNCWECLADAYLTRGAHLSALKSYERALQLNPESFYSMTQLSSIKLLVHQYDLAKEDFKNILKLNKYNIAALKGLSECCFKLGKKNAKAQLLARARDDYQEAMETLTEAVMQNNDFSCNWKLLGDICYCVAILPEKYCFLNVIPQLIQSDSQQNTEKITKKEIFLLSIRCYCRALNISQNTSLLWNDLALCYLAQLDLDNSIDNKEIIKKSLAAAKEAVKLDASAWFNWNLLGVICMRKEIKNYALAQHSFVMAIEKESNSSVAWTNLGSLYLLLGDLYRANEAFSWAQKIDPGYVNSWIGQALIAESLSPKDAMDLFRHSTQLNYHHEGAIGYTYWVIKTIMNPETKKDPLYYYNIEKMHAVTVAADHIHWYTVHFPQDPSALNVYGLLLERRKLYKSSTEQFLNALKYADDTNRKDLVNINLARVLVQEEKYEDAIKVCSSIKKESFASHCQLALSLFKAEHYKDSYEAYETALQWLANTESEKAHVLCAMAAMAYMFQESNNAKTLLYQSVGVQPPIISGLLALAALGMLEGDKNLTQIVLKELKSYDDEPEYRNHIAKLIAYSYLIQNDMESAYRVLCKYVHRYPDSSELWTTLAKILLRMSDISFDKCVDKALFLEKNSTSDQIAKITCMSSLSKLITLNPKDGIRSVLNTVHSFPATVDSWSNLITALLPRWTKISQFNAHWLMVLASRVRNGLTCTRTMEQWLLKNEKQANDIAYC